MMKIGFGTAKRGLEFYVAFEDRRWTTWFTSHYETSPKFEHQAFIEYVKKRVDQEIPLEATSATTPQPKAKMTAAKSKAKASVPTSSEKSWTQGQIRAPCGVRCGKPVGSIYGRAHAGNRNCPTGGQDGSGLPESSGAEQSNDPHGERHAGDPQPCSSTECQIRAMSTDHSASDESVPDTDFVFLSHPDSHNSGKQICRLIQQYQGELDSCLKSVQHQSHRRLDLLEVMCSSESELTKQMLHLGGSAMRFGRTEGDLKTPGGRKQLFLMMCRYQPRNIWYSPDCGPWCLWSNLNMNKSLALQEKILAQRQDHLWQISLGIVLLRFQKEHDRHFHSEQPNG